MQRQTFWEYFKIRWAQKGFLIATSVYIVLLFASAICWTINFDLKNLIMSVGFTLFALAIILAEHLLKIHAGNIFIVSIYFLAGATILGSCFNLYMVIPFLDLVQHCLSGVLFGCLGVTLARVFFGENKSHKNFFGCLLFGVFFSLAIATLWEIFEYGLTFVGIDMMEDAFVTKINSYLLSGTHNNAICLENISQTIVQYGNGQTYAFSGYLDIGLIDTLGDMLICTIGAIVFAVISIISHFKLPAINKALIPQITKESK